MSMLHSDVNDPEVSQAYRRLRTFANKVARELMAAHATSTPDGWLLHSFCRSDELTYGGGYSPEYKETTEEVWLTQTGGLTQRLVTVSRDTVIESRSQPLSPERAREYDGRDEWTGWKTNRGPLSVEEGWRKFHRPSRNRPPYLFLSNKLSQLRPQRSS